MVLGGTYARINVKHPPSLEGVQAYRDIQIEKIHIAFRIFTHSIHHVYVNVRNSIHVNVRNSSCTGHIRHVFLQFLMAENLISQTYLSEFPFSSSQNL